MTCQDKIWHVKTRYDMSRQGVGWWARHDKMMCAMTIRQGMALQKWHENKSTRQVMICKRTWRNVPTKHANPRYRPTFSMIKMCMCSQCVPDYCKQKKLQNIFICYMTTFQHQQKLLLNPFCFQTSSPWHPHPSHGSTSVPSGKIWSSDVKSIVSPSTGPGQVPW